MGIIPTSQENSRTPSAEAQQLWAKILDTVRADHPTIVRLWFEDLWPQDLDSGSLRVRCNDEFQRDHMERQCGKAFNEAARLASGRLVHVQFLGPNGRAGPSTPPRSARQLAINPDNTFENFVMGPGNRLAHAAAQAVAEEPGKRYNPLFIHGDVGLGKTHLLQAICIRIMSQHPDWVIEYVSCDEFTSQFMEAVQAGRMSDFRHEFRQVDMLVIDDVHFLAKRDRTQEEFFHTFNALYQTNRQIVLSSDAPPEDIPDLEDRLVSRFKWGLVTAVEAPDYETRIAIVQTKARLRGIVLGEGVAEHVAACIDSNIRELEGAITNLQIRAAVDGRPVDLALARETIAAPQREDAQASATMQAVLDAAIAFYGVKLSDLQAKKKTRSIARPRQVVMYLARKHTRHSLEEIGGYLGGRDHTTVMHGAGKVAELITSDPSFAAEIERLEARIAGDARG
ncbi:MAG: chromosomal replication initiator protein DnaA [Phycisphaeraceae bacterium]|nr:chromosomal replication initiator protein DnaA [Phycisphaeraceae bacterium]